MNNDLPRRHRRRRCSPWDRHRSLVEVRHVVDLEGQPMLCVGRGRVVVAKHDVDILCVVYYYYLAIGFTLEDVQAVAGVQLEIRLAWRVDSEGVRQPQVRLVHSLVAHQHLAVERLVENYLLALRRLLPLDRLLLAVLRAGRCVHSFEAVFTELQLVATLSFEVVFLFGRVLLLNEVVGHVRPLEEARAFVLGLGYSPGDVDAFGILTSLLIQIIILFVLEVVEVGWVLSSNVRVHT
eukprot:CAMPEP_0170488436 /NCGR_PEP_ID=MMETSP0208-20121228/6991_1 /TAXON_ID=197538 /ORGANISM="Strombidium inclinatum, Strain S3" /LENGTH=236 /DNA_ID=CAMNT_0010762999 /DNA_START=3001 /DNA_END=3711 /DNA_ORIENTATION=-